MKKSVILKILNGSKGLSLFMVLIMMGVFLVFFTATLSLSRVELKKASNLGLASQALEVAEAGLQHALALIPQGNDFDAALNCGFPTCTLVEPASFPPGSDFSYTVTARNDPRDDGGTNNDTNNVIILTSEANGPDSTRKAVKAYVGRSGFAFPAALYIDAQSAAPVINNYYFDNDDSIRIDGNDTRPNNLEDKTDDGAGPKASLQAILATSDTVTNALRTEFASSDVGKWHDIVGLGSEPSIATTNEILDVDAIAESFFNTPGAVKFLKGLYIEETNCPSAITQRPPNPVSCEDFGSSIKVTLGTASSPQLIYIKDDGTTNGTIELDAPITGYGVLVLEGRATLRGSFRFNGLVVHKRSATSHYFEMQDNAWVYGGVILGSFDEGDGQGKKVRFTVQDFVRIFYSSEAHGMVDSLWGTLFPRLPRIFAWHDSSLEDPS